MSNRVPIKASVLFNSRVMIQVIIVILLFCLSAIVLACKEDGCSAHLDWGSCGNACCSLAITTKDSPEAAIALLNATVSRGGPDKHYTAQVTAGGNLFFDDLRDYDVPKNANYIGQSFHVTDNGEFTDTQNWVVYPHGGTGSKIVGFSISQIGGAYGDDGQNWFNLNSVFAEAYPTSTVMHVDSSCQSASP